MKNPAWLGDPFAIKDNKIFLTKKVAKRLLAEAQEAFPYEYSALLAGHGATITTCVPMPISPDKHVFAWDGTTFLQALQHIRRNNLQWLGVLHTHPHTLPIPSARDIAGWHYPTLSYWIVGLASAQPAWHVYQWVQNGNSGSFEARSYTLTEAACDDGETTGSSPPKNS
ncbi:M67 family metallopeptidase [Brevibacillus sp. MER 51]|uniref:M67 family metallopeptidase n=1 Tax=Brevibacillus sp. MER 51 TaxID=2939560 RepID=UPI00203E0FD7|nr:M67 family metallopeptidase [Brevibacillus sp. MER 51]MCM3144298.1 M67 family metallopeptidase [Brevibacillus sp. MER 51]